LLLLVYALGSRVLARGCRLDSHLDGFVLHGNVSVVMMMMMTDEDDDEEAVVLLLYFEETTLATNGGTDGHLLYRYNKR
jgi:hypothetical protein